MLIYVVSRKTHNSLGWEWFYTKPEAQKELDFYAEFNIEQELNLYGQSVPDNANRFQISKEVHDVVFNIVEHTT